MQVQGTEMGGALGDGEAAVILRCWWSLTG